MALVNTPPITPPRIWLDDPALSKHVQELYMVIWQLFQRTGGGVDIISGDNAQTTINTGNIAINAAGIDENQNTWPAKIYSEHDFQLAFAESVQSEDYTTYTNEIIKLSADVSITLNLTPSDNERVYIKSTGKGYNVKSTKKVDGQTDIRFNRPYGGYWFSYSIELDTWSIL